MHMAGSNTRKKVRVAIVVSHPIQHFVPLYRLLAKHPRLELHVFFSSRIGIDRYYDPGFGVEFRWETNLLEGYESTFLANAGKIKDVGFWSVYAPDIGRKLDAFRPEVVQVYGYSQLAELQALAWCAMNRVPALLMSDSELLHRRPLLVRTVKRLLLPLIYRTVTGFLTIGDNNESYLRYYGVDQRAMFRSPYPTNDDLFLAVLERSSEVRRETRRCLDIPESAFVALFVGKLIPRKRPGDLLDAVQIAQARSGARMMALFAGDGELRSSLERRVREQGSDAARFAGFVNQAELPSMYAAADVLAHPAEVDPHPLAVTEGVLMGLPAVVSDRVGSAGASDTVRLNENGFVHPVGNTAALASALERLATDRTLWERMSRESRRIADEMSIQASVRGFVDAVNAAVRHSAM